MHDYIYEEAENARASFGAAATTPLPSSPLDNPRRHMKRAGGTHRAWAWRSILTDLERPITYVIFILMAAAQDYQPGPPVLVFADVASIENSNRSCYLRFLSLRGYLCDLSRGLESMGAYYEVKELERSFQRPPGHPYQSASSTAIDGSLTSGMKIEFRLV